MSDLIDRRAAIDALMKRDKELRNINWYDKPFAEGECKGIDYALEIVNALQSVQPQRKWMPCSNPPKHHKDVIVRGIEAIGNVTVHKVMQWDVDTWRPTDYAPSVTWKEWSEI